MQFDENKKALFVIGMNQKIRNWLEKEIKLKPENMLTLQIHGPEISQPYSDIMRAVILAVYQENVEEIFILGTTTDQQNLRKENIEYKVYDQAEMRGKVKIMNYLFKHCAPECGSLTLNAWLEGSETIIEGIQKSLKVLREHPLMPSAFRVHGLLLDMDTGELSEIDTCSTRHLPPQSLGKYGLQT